MSEPTLSQCAGPTDTPLLDETIGAAFDLAVARHGGREALIVPHQQTRLTYKELAQRVDELALGLLALGLQPGDRVGIWAPNCWEWTVTQFATAKAGLILVNINPAYRATELEYALTKVGCRALLLAEQFKSSHYVKMLVELIPEISQGSAGLLQSQLFPALNFLITLGTASHPGFIRYDEVCAAGSTLPRDCSPQAISDKLDADDPINIQFTSGTTGSPKGATLSHRNILNNGFLVGETIRLTKNDKVCIPVPLYHCFGMVMGNLACITHGSAMVYPGASFEPKAVLDTVEQEQCTALYGVPTMFVGVLEEKSFVGRDLSSLRTGIMAGSPCPQAIMQRVIDDMNMSDVTIAYGMTETSPVSTQTSVDDPLDKRVGTVGRVHPHVEVKVVADDGATLAPGEKGEFCTRGYSVMKGYWDDDERTAESVDDDGWMHTGDLAIMDEDGYFSIVGRLKDMVIRGGENVYPREVEEFLFSHPAIKDVSVFGVPDDKFGEQLCAWIQLKDDARATEDDIRNYCRDQIAHFKVPHYVRFVSEFPMTVTGKIQKFVMREKMIERLARRG